MAFFTGSFLVARPILQDPNFREAVVLLLQHGAEGAFGLVVNRPAPVQKALFPLFKGGPCPAQGLLMLHGHEDWLDLSPAKEGQRVAPGLFLGDAACLKKATQLSEGETGRYRVFTGYAGWGPGQLERELAAGAWTITSASGETLFDTPADDLWSQLIPPRIPQPSVN